jgi:cell division protein FtsL
MEQREGKLEWKKFLLNYQWMVSNIPFFLFLSLLTVVYIFNGHYAEKTIKDINRTARELKEVQYEYKTLRSELMYQSKQSEIVKVVEPLGLKELVQPPLKLKDTLY